MKYFIFLFAFLPKVSFALSQGPVYATTCVNEASTGTLSWSNPSNGVLDDGVYATVNINPGSFSNFLTCSGYVFSIPVNATVQGIQVDVIRYNSGNLSAKDATVLLTVNTASSTNKAVFTTWDISRATATYGGAADLWGLTLGQGTNDINSFNFKFSVDPLTQKIAQVDTAKITVFYSVPTTINNGTIYNGTLR